MAQINAYLHFNGNCREALTFYKECIDGEVTLQTIEGSPIEAHCPPGKKHHILHATLTNGHLMLMASDMAGPEGFQYGNTVALMLNCTSEEEINTYYNNLSQGGIVNDPLGKKFWGALFGAVTDKFGIRWMFHYDKNQNQSS